MKSSAKVVDLMSLPMCVYVVMIIYFEKVTLWLIMFYKWHNPNWVEKELLIWLERK